MLLLLLVMVLMVMMMMMGAERIHNQCVKMM